MKNITKKGCVLAIVLLISLPGCWGKKKKKAETPKRTTASVDIPTNETTALRSFFDEDLGEFVLSDEDAKNFDGLAADQKVADANDYAWIDKKSLTDQSFKKVQFGFDKYIISNDQKAVVAADVQAAKELLEKNPEAVIVVEGHACSSAGSAVYNFALGEKRGKVITDNLVASGIDSNNLKIVSRGMEMPVMIDGKPLTGSRDEQALNRRVEFLVVNA